MTNTTDVMATSHVGLELEDLEAMLLKVFAFYGHPIEANVLHTVILETFLRLYMQSVDGKGKIH